MASDLLDRMAMTIAVHSSSEAAARDAASVLLEAMMEPTPEILTAIEDADLADDALSFSEIIQIAARAFASQNSIQLKGEEDDSRKA